MAANMVRQLGELEGVEVLWSPIINQGVVRFTDPRPGATEEDHARQTDRVIAAVLASGEALFGSVVFDGKKAMRISVSNWQTEQTDVDRTVAAIARILESQS